MSTNATGGSTFTSLLLTLFIGLKLTGHIDWSWWWDTAPIWGPLALVLGMGLLVFAVAGIAELLRR